jgi:hypothetical protein
LIHGFGDGGRGKGRRKGGERECVGGRVEEGERGGKAKGKGW